MGTYSFSTEELSDLIVDFVENLEGDFSLKELRLAIKLAYSRIVSDSIELSKQFVEELGTK